MRIALLVALACTLAACSASEKTASGGTYSVQREGDGTVIQVSEGASAETLMAALRDAIELAKWVPPEAAGGLRQTRATKLEATGDMGITSVYTYDLPTGGFSVYIYRYPTEAEGQIAETQTALEELVRQERIDAVELKSQTTQQIPWDGGEATLHRVRFVETMEGAPYDSYMYLVKDDMHWIKARTTFPEGRYKMKDVDAMVLALLADRTG